MPDLISTRETPDEVRRERARQRIARDVRLRRLPPQILADADTLDYAYGRGHEGELQALTAELQELQAEDAEEHEQRERAADLHAMTDKVLGERAEAERRDAEAEARRRLGWDAK